MSAEKCLPDSKKVNSHISLARKTVTTSYIALFHSGSNISLWYNFERDTEYNLVTKL